MEVFSDPVVSYINIPDIRVIQVQASGNPNLNQSSCSSSSSRSLEFLVDFIIHDFPAPLYLFTVPPVEPRSIKSSSPIWIQHDLTFTNAWIDARLELYGIGLQCILVEVVVSALQARVHEMHRDFFTYHQGCGRATVHLQVNITRFSMLSVFDAFGQFQWIPVLPPVTSDQKRLAMQTLEKVEAEDEESLKDMSCAICLEDLHVVVDLKKVRDEAPARLPCKHTFHQGCLRRWFTNKRHSCPLCRTDVITSH